MMISKTQKQFLKGIANNLRPLVQIGKGGLTDNVLESIDEILTAHEIVKIDVLKSCEQSVDELTIEISRVTGSDLVSQLGRKIVLFRRNREKPVIDLPRK